MTIVPGLEATSLAILLVPAFLPFFFLAQNYLTPPPSHLPRNQDRACVIMCFFVFLLGPIAAAIAALRIGMLVSTSRRDSLSTILTILQNFVELSYRLPILLLLNHSSILVRSTKSTISDKWLDIHNITLAILISTSFVLVVIHIVIPSNNSPFIIPTTLTIITDLFPIPLQCHFTRIPINTPRIRRTWLFLIVNQFFSVLVAALGIPRGPIFSVLTASFTVLWFGSVTTLFYSLYASPITSSSSSASGVVLSPLSPTSLATERTSSPQVFYENSPHRTQRQSSRGLVSEDFTALRDPFASPTRAGPHAKSPEPYAPVTPPTTPQVLRSPTTASSPTLQSKTHPSARHMHDKSGVKHSLQQISSRFTHTSSVEKKESTQSLQPLADKAKDAPEDNKPVENESFFLNDEALLSQILLHSLTTEAIPTSRTPRPTNPRQNHTGGTKNNIDSGRTTRKTHCRNRNVVQSSAERLLGAGKNASNFVFRSSESKSISGTQSVMGSNKVKQNESNGLTASGDHCSCWWDEA